jgi:hypothetical protein
LGEERVCFRDRLGKYTTINAEHRGVVFHPVGWEDTLGGVGRPQALINEDLKQCDYAVFLLHDRWGSPTGGGYTSGTEEEWTLAEQLYRENTLRNITLFFKKVAPRQIQDPGKQLEAVLRFKKGIAEGKQYLFQEYDTVEQFAEAIEGHLSRWLRDHESTASNVSTTGLVTGDTVTIVNSGSNSSVPSFEYWVTKATKLLEAEVPDHSGALFCGAEAVGAAKSDIEWARAINVEGIAQLGLGKLDAAIVSFTAIAERFANPKPAKPEPKRLK